MDQKFSGRSLKSGSIKLVLASLFILLATTFGRAEYSGYIVDTDVTISSTGVVNGEMIFTLKYDNTKSETLEIVITDKDGTRLYRKLSSDKKLNTTFKIPADLGTVYVTVNNATDKTQKRFMVSSQERLVEKVVIGSVR